MKFLNSKLDDFTLKAIENHSQFLKDKRHYQQYAKDIAQDGATLQGLDRFWDSLEIIDLINKKTDNVFYNFLNNNITDMIEYEIKNHLIDTQNVRKKQLENKKDKLNKSTLTRNIEKKQNEYFAISDLINEVKQYFYNMQ